MQSDWSTRTHSSRLKKREYKFGICQQQKTNDDLPLSHYGAIHLYLMINEQGNKDLSSKEEANQMQTGITMGLPVALIINLNILVA